MEPAVPEHIPMRLEVLLERARRLRLVWFTRMNGETITFQIGRVVYVMDCRKAERFLEEALGSGLEQSRMSPPI